MSAATLADVKATVEVAGEIGKLQGALQEARRTAEYLPVPILDRILEALHSIDRRLESIEYHTRTRR